MNELNFRIAGFIFVLAIILTGCQPQNTNVNQTVNTNANTSVAANAKWDGYVETFLADYFMAHPDVAVYAGKHDFDGKLPDWSEDGLKKEVARLKNERDKASAFKDDQLDERQRFERDYLIAQIDKDVFWRETADQPHTNPYFYADSIDPTFTFRELTPRLKRGSNHIRPTLKMCRTPCRRSRQI